jgi:ribosomal protein L37AE/L43A
MSIEEIPDYTCQNCGKKTANTEDAEGWEIRICKDCYNEAEEYAEKVKKE